MSNDTPTGPHDRDSEQKPDDAAPATPAGGAASDGTPTERFDAAAAAAESDAETGDPADAPIERFEPVNDDATADSTTDTDAATKLLPTNDHVTPAPYYPPTNPPTAATTRLPANTPPAAPVQPATSATPPPGGSSPAKKSRTLLYWLIGIGAALLIAVIVLLVMLFGNGDAEPTPTATPTETQAPSATPTPTPEPTEEPEPTPTPTTPPATGPTFATFTAPNSAQCAEGEDEAPLTFSWSSDDAVKAYLGVGTQNAALTPTVSDLPPTATYDDLPFDCSVASQVYTVTLENEAGALTSRTVTITR